MMTVLCLVTENEVSPTMACEALSVSRAAFYRWRDTMLQPVSCCKPLARPHPPLALSDTERQCVLDVLHSPSFVDKTPYEVYAALLDAGTYLCSIRTMYRLLAREGEIRERRNQLRHPNYKKPELLAEAPNQVWSWDITKLKGPVKWVYYYLYVIMDIFSRYVVGWMVAHTESASLAKRLIDQTCKKQGIAPGQLTIHADRGSSMSSKSVAQLMADLGVIKTHSRPHVSNDNPYSEAQFKTMKYCPIFPGRFGSIQDARVFCQSFFPWYNIEHYHTGIGLLTPHTIHYGLHHGIIEARSQVMLAAFEAHPKRFKGNVPSVPQPPAMVWINPPETEADTKIRH